MTRNNNSVILAISLITVGILTSYIPMADAVPPMERVSLSNITTSEENDTLQVDEQVMINVDLYR